MKGIGLLGLCVVLAAGCASNGTAAANAGTGKKGGARVILISGDIEGMSGYGAQKDKAGNDRLLNAHFTAAAEGLHEGGAKKVLLKSFHGVPGTYPEFVELVRKRIPGEFDLPGLEEHPAGLAMVGFHGLPPECAFGHCYRFRYLYLNGKKIGEITIQVMRAARAGVPTVFYAGDSCGAKEFREAAPGAVVVELRKGWRGNEGDMDPKMLEALREGAKEAAERVDEIAVPKLPDKFVLGVPMANEAAAQLAPKMLSYPVKVEGRVVSRESTEFMDVYAFLQDMFRVCDEAKRIEKAELEKKLQWQKDRDARRATQKEQEKK